MNKNHFRKVLGFVVLLTICAALMLGILIGENHSDIPYNGVTASAEVEDSWGWVLIEKR